MRVGSSVILPVPPAEAWRLLTRWEEQARWMRDADRVEVRSDHREGEGVIIAVKTRVLNVPLFTERLEVTVWDPPRRLVLVHRSFVHGLGVWAFEPAEGGTRFSWIEDLSLGVPLLGELALRVYRPFMRRLMRGALADLRTYVLAT